MTPPPLQLSPDRVSQFAPDSASLAAGKRLSTPHHWYDLGYNGEAIWGICRGSADYQVRLSMGSFASRCTCPSRKFPCKHSLGLLLLAASTPQVIPEDEPPDWVTDWLEKHKARAASEPQLQQPAPSKSADAEAKQKRQQKREANVQAGLERLETWMKDLLRNGLAGLERKPRAFWDDQAKRLVDAQASGVAGRVRRLADLPRSSPAWPQLMLVELGRTQLLIEAFRRIGTLPIPLQQDVRQLVGWNVSQQELEASGELIEDEWALYGQTVEDDDRLRVQRTWGIGLRTGRPVLILQFAVGLQPFGEAILTGTVQHAAMRFYPGALALRGKLEVRLDAPRPISSGIPGGASVQDFLNDYAERLARFPWLGAYGGLLQQVTLSIQGDTWYVRDRVGDALPLAGRDYWTLLSVTGGHPCDLMGEWTGTELRPLAYFSSGGQYRGV